MTLPTGVRFLPGVVSQKVGDEIVILHLEKGFYFSLDPIGSRIWELLQEKNGIDRLIPTILQEYDVEEARLRIDILELLERMREKGLVAF